MSARREKRACALCGFVRTVVIRSLSTIGGDGEEYWNEHCSICDLEIRARRHEKQAWVFRQRAARLREKRRTKHDWNKEPPTRKPNAAGAPIIAPPGYIEYELPKNKE